MQFPEQDSKMTSNSPVCSYTEWDLLEEVIVGVVDGACVPPWHEAMEPCLPTHQHQFFKDNAGKSFPEERINLAREELNEFARILECEGVKVRRPEPKNQKLEYGAPGWSSTGMYAAMPRDVLLVVGTDIIECPLAWRSRYFETSAYKKLLKEYFHGGARWSAGPKPDLSDEQYVNGWTEDETATSANLVITEFEPTFDAADFTRLGKDIIAQKSNVTNEFGINWLQRHLGGDYKIHILEFNDMHPMHIDATLVPLAPGKLLVNPERVQKIPEIFRGWDVIHAPKPIMPDSHPLYMTSKWINMNILMLDEQRVVVERQDEPMIKAMKAVGLEPVLCDFRNFNSFGGSFHCATVDVRRRGKLESYLV
ncbi:amidinotransferase [Pseudomonas caricapapayae]|nr:amidinotransferase [Pseudomonas caricapapayae]